MGHAITITLPDRGNVSYTSEVTVGDALFFGALLMTPAERAVLFDPNNPDLERAYAMFEQRQSEQADKIAQQIRAEGNLTDEQVESLVEREMNRQWVSRLMTYLEGDRELRRNVAARIREIFPDFPETLVYATDYNPRDVARIRLEPQEILVNLLLPIYGTLAANQNAKQLLEPKTPPTETASESALTQKVQVASQPIAKDPAFAKRRQTLLDELRALDETEIAAKKQGETVAGSTEADLIAEQVVFSKVQ